MYGAIKVIVLTIRIEIHMKLKTIGLFCSTLLLAVAAPVTVFAAGDLCGGTNYHQVKTSVTIGCKQFGNPIADMLFAILRFLTFGVGIVITGSLIYAGLQYIFSRDDPSAVGAAKNRILHTVLALIIFIFSYALLAFLIPSGFFVP